MINLVYWPTIQYIIASALIMVTFFVLSPFVYSFWYDNARPLVPNTAYSQKLLFAGDLLFNYWMVFGYFVPGIIIAWGFAAAARTGTQEQNVGYGEE